MALALHPEDPYMFTKQIVSIICNSQHSVKTARVLTCKTTVPYRQYGGWE